MLQMPLLFVTVTSLHACESSIILNACKCHEMHAKLRTVTVRAPWRVVAHCTHVSLYMLLKLSRSQKNYYNFI
jgi:hypothetical protein